jgi:fimbrial isopeptide formation D2 family protein/uncharacterized repeat protein (TIGR01451 family)
LTVVTGSDTSVGSFTTGQTVVCTLPTGTVPGTYTFEYTATEDSDATNGTINNVVVPSGGGDPDPSCTTVGGCDTDHPLGDPNITASKSSNPADGTTVIVGQTITYTLSATVSDAATTAPTLLTDTLGAGLTFGTLTAPAVGSCTTGQTVVCRLPTGTVPGTYTFSYTATVDADATNGTINNVVVPSGGGDPTPECTTLTSCDTDHPLGNPNIVASKSANPVDGTTVVVGQTITYTLSATVSDAATTAPTLLTDTLGSGLTFGALSAPAVGSCTTGQTVGCSLPTGTVPGTYT